MQNCKFISIVAHDCAYVDCLSAHRRQRPMQPTATPVQPEPAASERRNPPPRRWKRLPSEVVSVPTEAELAMPNEISLPPGFKIGVYASDIPNARSMVLSPDGTLFVGHT